MVLAVWVSPGHAREAVQATLFTTHPPFALLPLPRLNLARYPSECGPPQAPCLPVRSRTQLLRAFLGELAWLSSSERVASAGLPLQLLER